MRLTELEPQFLCYKIRRKIGTFAKPDGTTEQREHDQVYYLHVDCIEDAQGIKFLCPKCFEANKGNVGTHAVVCWSRSRGVPDKAEPGPGRWALKGTGYADLTLDGDGGSRSVLLTGEGCGWHGFVTNGEVTLT